MADLKLPRLPDRTPAKITINVMPDLIEALNDYAEAYEAAYGRRESVPDLIPFMLSGFLASDRSKSKIYQLIASGDIEAAKVGRATVVFVDSLRSFLRSHCKQPRSRA